MEEYQLGVVFGKKPIDRIMGFYSKLWAEKYGMKPILSYPMVGRLFKPLFAILSEYQIALLILIHFNWRGANNDDDFVEKGLKNNSYPITWIPRNVNQYMAFAKNYLGVDFNNNEDVKKYVDKIKI